MTSGFFAAVAVLVGLNGLFVAAEFAFVAVPWTAIEHRAQRGEWLARLVRWAIDDTRRRDRFIATAQLGITFASLGLGMYGEHRLAEWLAVRFDALGVARWVAAHTLASTVAVGFLTYLHIVVGEMVPKALALQQADATSRLVAIPMFVTKALLFPLVLLLDWAGTIALRLLGVNRQQRSQEHYLTAEELELVVQESTAEGKLHPEAGLVLRELLTFGDLTAREVMVPRVRVTGIEVGTPAAALRTRLVDSTHTRYPVFVDSLDRIVGFVHVKKVFAVIEAGRPLGASDALPIPMVPETAPLDAVLELMRAQPARMAVVIDEHGGTSGLVTIADLFEELVGEFEEGDTRRPSITTRQGRLYVAGTVRLDEVGARLAVDLEHPEVDSVSGLVLALLDRIPRVGDVVDYADVRLEVLAVSGNGVLECAVWKPDTKKGASETRP